MLEDLYIYPVVRPGNQADSKVITHSNEVRGLYIYIFMYLSLSSSLSLSFSLLSTVNKSPGIPSTKAICSGKKKELSSGMGSNGELSPRRNRKFFAEEKRKLRGGAVAVLVPYCSQGLLPARLQDRAPQALPSLVLVKDSIINFNTI